MTFSTPEREFLRQMARADVTAAELVPLVSEDFGWDWVLVTARDHQLDGVLYWRLTQPEMKESVPETIASNATYAIERLNQLAEPWKADASRLCEALDRIGIPYAVIGGPATYTTYPLPHWPRYIDHIEVTVPPHYFDTLWDLCASEFGAERARRPALHPSPLFDLPGGLRAACWCLPDRFRLTEHFFMARPEYCDDPVRLALHGEFTAPVVRPEYHLALCAYKLYTGAVCFDAAPAPLFELVRLHNWAVAEGFDWQLVPDLLERAEAERRLVQSRRELDPNPDLVPEERDRIGAFVHWSLAYADRIYNFVPPEVMERVAPELPPGGPIIWTSAPDRPYEHLISDGASDTVHWLVCEWDQWPGDEEFLFDYRYRTGVDQRLADGLWSRLRERDLPRHHVPWQVQAAAEIDVPRRDGAGSDTNQPQKEDVTDGGDA